MHHKLVSLKSSAKFILPITLLVFVGFALLLSPVAPEDCRVAGNCLELNDPDLEAPDQPDKAAEFRLLSLQDENGEIPHNALMRAVEHVDLMIAEQGVEGSSGDGRDSAALNWTWLGPGNIGGRVRSLLIHPTTPSKMWTGSVGGGIWATTDGGASWAPVDDFMANLAVSTMVMDPNNANTMYAGTGEGFHNVDALRGAGVFKSTDGGGIWTQLASTTSADWYYVNRMAISPNGATLLAATSTNIFRSTNGGTSWTSVLTTSDMQDVKFHPTDSSKAVAGGNYGKAYYSTDGGATWTPSTGLPGTGVWLARVELGYAPSAPSTVYASVNVNNGELWKSTNGGVSYTLVNTGNSFLSGQGWYDNIIWVDPTNSSTLAIGGVDLYRSTDAGVNLTQISSWQWSPDSAHADHHIIVEHPGFNGTSNKTVFFGNDGGMYKTDDVYTVAAGGPPNGWQELNNELGITQYYGAAGNNTSGVIVGGTQDNGTLRYAGDTEGVTTMFGGDGGFNAADQTDPNYFYGEYTELQIHRSTDAGLTSSYITAGLGDAGVCANFIAPFVIDSNNYNRILGGGCSLWRSNNVKDAVPSWAIIKTTTGSNISAISIQPTDANTIYVGHNNGDIYATLNGLATNPTWTQVDDPGMPNAMVTRVTADPTNIGTAYATFGGFASNNVWRTTNYGTSWTEISGSGATGLPDVPVRSLVVHPDDAAKLYVGTEVGIFVSADTGANWTVPHEGPANVSVDELFWMNYDLVAATHGRGLYKTNLAGLINDDFDSPIVVPSTPYNNMQDTTDATTAGDDPTLPCGPSNQGHHSVWYSFTAPSAGLLTVDTNGSDYDTVLSVWTGPRGSLANEACDDDGGTGTQSQIVDLPLMAGVTYHIEIVGYSASDFGELHIAASFVPDATAVPNDDFDMPIAVPSTPYNNMQDTTDATTAGDDPTLPCGPSNQGHHSVWYSFTAPSAGLLTVDTNGSDYDTVLSVWTGPRGSLANEACDDDGGTGTQSQIVDLPLMAGVTYHIEIVGYSASDFGELHIAASFVPDAGDCTDDSLEPNDSFGTATNADPLPYSQSGLKICPGNDDYFMVTISTLGDVLMADIGFSNAAGNLDLEIYNSAMQLVDSSATDTDDEHAEYLPLTTGIYYVKVLGRTGMTENSYDLDISYGGGCTDDFLEPNDSFGEATDASPLPYSQSNLHICPNNDDYFEVTVTSIGEVLEIDIWFTHASGDLDMVLYDSAMQFLAESESGDDNEHIEFTPTQTGTYYVKVYGYQGAENSYDLDISYGGYSYIYLPLMIK